MDAIIGNPPYVRQEAIAKWAELKRRPDESTDAFLSRTKNTILQNFKIVAIMESLDEPWFQDARVKTAVTILQRCTDEQARAANLVRFVRFHKPVSKILC